MKTSNDAMKNGKLCQCAFIANKIKKLAIFFVFAKLSSYGKKQFLVIFNGLPETFMILFKPAKIAASQKISGVLG